MKAITRGLVQALVLIFLSACTSVPGKDALAQATTLPPAATPPSSQAITTPSATPVVSPSPSPLAAAGTLTPDLFPETQIIEVVDGDTIKVLLDGQVFDVRYIGIDTPEKEEVGWETSRGHNSTLLSGGSVRLEQDVSNTDPYDRLLRYVWIGDLMVNAELVRLGYARAAAYPPDTKYQATLEALQTEAQVNRRGFWATPMPTPVAGHELVILTGMRRDGAVSPQESDEYVEITNQGPSLQDLTGWRLESERGAASEQVFRFPAGFIIRAGQVCRVYTNEVHPEWCSLSFGHHSGVWSNNYPDAALLYDDGGALVSSWE